MVNFKSFYEDLKKFSVVRKSDYKDSLKGLFSHTSYKQSIIELKNKVKKFFSSLSNVIILSIAIIMIVLWIYGPNNVFKIIFIFLLFWLVTETNLFMKKEVWIHEYNKLSGMEWKENRREKIKEFKKKHPNWREMIR